MCVFTFLIIQLMFPQASNAESLQPFNPRIYTPSQVVDSENQGAKGAVQLLWEKKDEGLRYEVQIDNSKSIYSVVTENHFFHTMLYFNKDYRWRVRSLGSKLESDFSQWASIKVLSQTKDLEESDILEKYKSSEDLQELAFDQGG